MKITAIKQQLKRTDRYSVFVDDAYSFSLSEHALLESKLASGQELNRQQLDDYKQLSSDDKLYIAALRYAAMRLRTTWEVTVYLDRKQASPPLVTEILNKLSKVGLLDDEAYAKAYVHDKQVLRPSSRRKIIMDLRKKHVPSRVIEEVMEQEQPDERVALQKIITNKRRQLKYQDDTKLMAYLARQGFRYDDIKYALEQMI